MRPEDWKAFGGGAASSSLHPAAIALLVLGILMMWTLPRQHVIKPFLILAILIPLQQQLVAFGLHFMALRILIVCAWIRVLPDLVTGSRFPRGGRTAIDIVFTLWASWLAVSYTLLWGDLGALVTKLGFLLNALGAYFLFRYLIRDVADVHRALRFLAGICAILAILMVVERFTGRNLLAIFGMPEFAEVRQGRVRSQASFAHSIIAGTFAAFLMPAFVTLWWSRLSRGYCVMGTVATALMVVTSSSSTPVGATLAGLAAICVWPLRKCMRVLRWSALATLVMLQLVMKGPVWSLVGRVHLVGGSTSWHRFALIDECIRRVSEWWLIGTTSNDAWGYSTWDTANWYVSSAITGGLIGLVLFITIIALAFRSVGIARRINAGSLENEWLAWGLGSGLFAAAVAFIGIELFDQSIVGWYGLLAMITAMSLSLSPITCREAPEDSVATTAESTFWDPLVQNRLERL